MENFRTRQILAYLKHRKSCTLAELMKKFDAYYPQPNGASPLQQLANQLSNPLPFDLDDTDLSQYKHLDEMYQDWNKVRDICAHIAVDVIHPML